MPLPSVEGVALVAPELQTKPAAQSLVGPVKPSLPQYDPPTQALQFADAVAAVRLLNVPLGHRVAYADPAGQ